MRLLLRAYPRRWRERYGEEMLALLEAEPLSWRTAANVVVAGLGERLRGPGPPPMRVLWAWSIFVVGGMAFQKTSEHWQVVVPGGDRGVPTAAFDAVQVSAGVGSVTVLAAVVLALPAFLDDLRTGGWAAMRRPILWACAGTVLAVSALVAFALSRSSIAVPVFIAAALFSLFAWTHAAAVAARRQPPLRAHTYLAPVVSVTMFAMTIGAGVWFDSVAAHSATFVGGAQLATVVVFMLTGTALAAAGSFSALRA